MNPVFVGGALGALAMYLLDPQSGRRRRARARDQLVHASRVLNDAGKVTARDAAQRAQGIAANEGQPPRPQPETEKLVRELMAKQGITIASL